MATLTQLDEKLAEVLGLAQAAQKATDKVGRLAKDEDVSELATLMQQMGDEAAELERRCTEVAGTRDGKKTAIEDKARETKSEITDFMTTYLEDGDALDGLEFLSMSEAGELAHWKIVEKLNDKAGDPDIGRLVEFAVPVQQQHVASVADQALELAADEDPDEES